MKKIMPLVFLASVCLVGAEESAESKPKTLAEKLEERANQKNPKITPEISKAFKDGLSAVEKADVVAKAKQVGDIAPDFTLKNAVGKEITLSNELKKGPVIITWYRGGW